jgi:hypothetical protein
MSTIASAKEYQSGDRLGMAYLPERAVKVITAQFRQVPAATGSYKITFVSGGRNYFRNSRLVTGLVTVNGNRLLDESFRKRENFDLTRSFTRSAPWRKLRSGSDGHLSEPTKLVLAAIWARPYDKLGMDPRFFRQQSIGCSQLICRTVPRSLSDMAESAPNLSGLSRPVVHR